MGWSVGGVSWCLHEFKLWYGNMGSSPVPPDADMHECENANYMSSFDVGHRKLTFGVGMVYSLFRTSS